MSRETIKIIIKNTPTIDAVPEYIKEVENDI